MARSNVRPAWWMDAGAVMPTVEWVYKKERYLDFDEHNVVEVVIDYYPVLQATPMRRRLKGGHTDERRDHIKACFNIKGSTRMLERTAVHAMLRTGDYDMDVPVTGISLAHG